MDKKVYEKTRYQNIYRHKKNKNYLIMISKPVKTSISEIDGKKIMKIEDAINIRDNPKIKLQKEADIIYKDGFEELWEKYMNICEYEFKLSYRTQEKKRQNYIKYFKGNIPKPSKLTKDFMAKFINDLECSEKQKNEIIKILKAFFNWCVREDIIIKSPLINIKRYKTVKEEMKYWLPDDVKKFFDYINNNLNEKNSSSEVLYRIKMLVMISFSLGCRIGETRALTFNSINNANKTITINHSIEYDPKKETFLKFTKTKSSQRIIDISDKLITEINNYRNYLEKVMQYNIDDDSIIFFNHITNKPLSDTLLRKEFYEICEKAGVPKIRLYDLRHTYTVIALNYDNIDMWAVSSKLGHSNITTTINTYNHITNKIRKELANSTDKYY